MRLSLRIGLLVGLAPVALTPVPAVIFTTAAVPGMIHTPSSSNRSIHRSDGTGRVRPQPQPRGYGPCHTSSRCSSSERLLLHLLLASRLPVATSRSPREGYRCDTGGWNP